MCCVRNTLTKVVKSEVFIDNSSTKKYKKLKLMEITAQKYVMHIYWFDNTATYVSLVTIRHQLKM